MRLGGYWLRLATPFALIVAGVVAGAAQRNDPPMLFALAATAFAATVITSAVQARRVVASSTRSAPSPSRSAPVSTALACPPVVRLRSMHWRRA